MGDQQQWDPDLAIYCRCDQPMRHGFDNGHQQHVWRCETCGTNTLVRDDRWWPVHDKALAGGLTRITASQLLHALKGA